MGNQNVATLEALLKENSKIIKDCLSISNVILTGLTANECNQTDTVTSPECMMAEVAFQSNDLKLLKDMLLDIKTTMLNA